MFARRAHLYLGLFLLPWVLLYGITGPMFSHKELFANAKFQSVSLSEIQPPLDKFPELSELAVQVTEQLRTLAPDNKIELNKTVDASITGAVSFEMDGDDSRIIVDIDPISEMATIARYPLNKESPKKLLQGIREITLPKPPLEQAKQALDPILKKANITDAKNPRVFGWTKLNFIGKVDDIPARFTYVYNDNHINIAQYSGEDGMMGREFFMRLHTTHGFPIQWNARRLWIVLSDLMGIAMVSWALTGLLMWWQIKRTRIFGAVVIGCSILVATLLYLGVHHFYATNVL